VAAHCIMEGLVDEGMRVAAAARDRYSGEKRNPYNDIECGDHYVRAMSGWTILDALSGYRYNAVTGSLAFAPISSPDVTDESGTFRAPFVTASGWGQFEQANDGAVRLTALHGEILIQTLVVPGADVTLDSVRINGSPVDATVRDADGKATVQFPEPIILNPGDMLQVDR
ncbi:MAG: glycoside hydrolase family 116 protein, partial [Chloroflexota bacterium]|nr:glycoside hydrolase family 116 protein [Chloroflexota bacterium]